MAEFLFTVAVEADTRDAAEVVINERIGYDEDLSEAGVGEYSIYQIDPGVSIRRLTDIDEVYVLVDLSTGEVCNPERIVAVRSLAPAEKAFDSSDSALLYAKRFGRQLWVAEPTDPVRAEH